MVGMAHEIWDQERIRQRRHRYFSWIAPPSAHLRHFNWSFENSCTARMVSPNITQKGLSLKGFVWNINQRLFLPEVQQKYSEHSSQYLDQLEHKAMGDAYRGIFCDIFRELYKQNLTTLAVAIWRFLRILVCLPAFHIPSQLSLVGQYVHRRNPRSASRFCRKIQIMMPKMIDPSQIHSRILKIKTRGMGSSTTRTRAPKAYPATWT